MPNKNYINGANRERRIIKKLEPEDWFCIRSAGSHSPVDIVAIKRQYYMGYTGRKYSEILIRLIQSKKTGRLTPKEQKEKQQLERKLGIQIEVM